MIWSEIIEKISSKVLVSTYSFPLMQKSQYFTRICTSEIILFYSTYCSYLNVYKDQDFLQVSNFILCSQICQVAFWELRSCNCGSTYWKENLKAFSDS